MAESETYEDIISKRYAQLPPEITDLIEFKVVDLTVENLATKYSLSRTHKELVKNEILLVLLLFFPRKDFEKRVQESLETDTVLSSMITEYVQTELFDLIDDLLTITDKGFLLNFPKDESVQNISQTNTIPIETTPIAETLEQVKPLRTMETDAKRIHGYGVHDKDNISTNIEEGEEVIHSSSQDSIFPSESEMNTTGIPSTPQDK